MFHFSLIRRLNEVFWEARVLLEWLEALAHAVGACLLCVSFMVGYIARPRQVSDPRNTICAQGVGPWTQERIPDTPTVPRARLRLRSSGWCLHQELRSRVVLSGDQQ